MIGYLKGIAQVAETDAVIVACGGVGYEVTCLPNEISNLRSGEAVELFIYTQVRDDAIQLFGFVHQVEKQMFLSLIKVNGVGPKSAMQILASATVGQLTDLINSGDAKGLSQLPKLGKKTAEQMILTLKGKLVHAEVGPSSSGTMPRKEIVSALVNLGFRLSDVERVVREMPNGIDIENGVRQGLSALTE